MKNGFTMIELIFVIVILGILAATAFPKFGKMNEEALSVKLKNFESSLNETVSPTVWSKVVRTGKADLANLKGKYQKLSTYIKIPKTFKLYSANGVHSNDANLSYTKTHSYNGVGYKDILGNKIPSKCDDGFSPFALKVAGHEKTTTFRTKINNKIYRVSVCNGTSTNSPKFYIWTK